MADILDLFGEDPSVAQAQARALADAMQRRRAVGTIASIIGGPFSAAGKAFLDDAEQTQGQLAHAGQFRGQQGIQTRKMAQDATQHQAQLAAQSAGQAESARHNRATEGLATSAQEQDAWSAVPDQTGGVVMYNRKTGAARPMGPQGPAPGAPPRLPTFKNEDQSKSFSFAERMREARRQMLEAGYPSGMEGRKDAAAMGAQSGPISSLVPQEAASEPGSRYFNAARNLVAALLRKESGAAISNDEWKQFTGLYIPMPWDSPEARDNKLKLLDLMERSMTAAAGPSAQKYWEGAHPSPATPTPSPTPQATVRKFTRGPDGKLVEVKP